MYKISVLPSEIDSLPLTSFDGEIIVVDRIGKNFIEGIEYLKRQEIIGFDTETKPCFGPEQRSHGVALLQLSGPDRAYLFRLKKLFWLKKLFKILSNDKIIKVGAAVNDDIRGLQRLSRFEPKSFVDLQQIVWEYGIKDKSVRKMAAIILGIRISKTQQLSNWEAPELSEAQQKYGATDAWVCLEMYRKLQRSRKHPLTEEQMRPPLPNPPHNANEGNTEKK